MLATAAASLHTSPCLPSEPGSAAHKPGSSKGALWVAASRGRCRLTVYCTLTGATPISAILTMLGGPLDRQQSGPLPAYRCSLFSWGILISCVTYYGAEMGQWFQPTIHRQAVCTALHGIPHPGTLAPKSLISTRFAYKRMDKKITSQCRDC
jgi:hypothetical protein